MLRVGKLLAGKPRYLPADITSLLGRIGYTAFAAIFWTQVSFLFVVRDAFQALPAQLATQGMVVTEMTIIHVCSLS